MIHWLLLKKAVFMELPYNKTVLIWHMDRVRIAYRTADGTQFCTTNNLMIPASEVSHWSATNGPMK